MRARILAAVALSKLGVSKVVPVLRGWVEESLGDPNSDAGRAQRRLLFRTARTDENQRAESEEQRLLSVQIAPQGVSWRLARHHVEMADALARLGDYTLVDEALDALVDIRGQFQSYAYHVLVQLLGARAYPRAAEHLRRKDPLLLRSLRWYALDQLDSQDMRAEAVRLLRENDDLLLSKRSLVKKLQLVEVSDRLVELFQEYARDDSSMVSFVLETLCELGDPRALALASDDPLLLARLAPYLAGAPLDAALDRSSKYNRVQDALVLQQWYRLNADALLWDGAIRRFKIEG